MRTLNNLYDTLMIQAGRQASAHINNVVIVGL